MVIRMDWLDAMIAERVWCALGEAGVDSGDLLEPLGIGADALADRLAARCSFTLEELARIAARLGCRTVDLLPGGPR